MQRTFLRILIISTLLFSFAEARNKQKLKLEKPLLESLNEVIYTSTQMQSSIVNDDPSIAEYMQKIQLDLGKLQQQIREYTGTEVNVLERILKRAKADVEIYLDTEVSEDLKQKKLYSTFKQMAQLSQTFPVDDKFYIFHCTRDKSEWVQLDRRPRNPVNTSNRRSCGIRVK